MRTFTMAIIPSFTCLAIADSARAQASLPEAIVHVWVDPHYGDDTQAAANNPTPTNYCTCPTCRHPPSRLMFWTPTRATCR